MRMRFSERVGANKPRDVMQIESIDTGLRARLWNALSEIVLREPNLRAANLRIIADGFLKVPVHYEAPAYESILNQVANAFAKADWAYVYDLVEFMVDRCASRGNKQWATDRLNRVLAEEMSGYRFVDGVLCQISDPEEIAEVERAIGSSEGIPGVRLHIDTALSLMKPGHPNYRNSVKESISAVEAACAHLLGQKGTLDELLKKLYAKIDIHRALQGGFGKLYGWTSDAGGIRHALLDQSAVEAEDARYMLVACSAFINYLYAKADRAGLSSPAEST